MGSHTAFFTLFLKYAVILFLSFASAINQNNGVSKKLIMFSIFFLTRIRYISFLFSCF